MRSLNLNDVYFLSSNMFHFLSVGAAISTQRAEISAFGQLGAGPCVSPSAPLSAASSLWQRMGGETGPRLQGRQTTATWPESQMAPYSLYRVLWALVTSSA